MYSCTYTYIHIPSYTGCLILQVPLRKPAPDDCAHPHRNLFTITRFEYSHIQ